MRSTSSNRSSFSKKAKPLNNKPTSSRVVSDNGVVCDSDETLLYFSG